MKDLVHPDAGHLTVLVPLKVERIASAENECPHTDLRRKLGD